MSEWIAKRRQIDDGLVVITSAAATSSRSGSCARNGRTFYRRRFRRRIQSGAPGGIALGAISCQKQFHSQSFALNSIVVAWDPSLRLIWSFTSILDAFDYRAEQQLAAGRTKHKAQKRKIVLYPFGVWCRDRGAIRPTIRRMMILCSLWRRRDFDGRLCPYRMTMFSVALVFPVSWIWPVYSGTKPIKKWQKRKNAIVLSKSVRWPLQRSVNGVGDH